MVKSIHRTDSAVNSHTGTTQTGNVGKRRSRRTDKTSKEFKAGTNPKSERGHVSKDNSLIIKQQIQAIKHIVENIPDGIQKESDTPIRDERIKIIDTKKKLKAAEKEMSKVAKTYLSAGFVQGLGESVTGTDFMGIQDLTNACSKRKSDNTPAFNFAGTVEYNIFQSELKNNVKDANNRSFSAKPLGDRYQGFDNPTQLGRRSIQQHHRTMKTPADFPLDFRYRSVIFPLVAADNQNDLSEFIQRTTNDTAETQRIMQTFLHISTNIDRFEYHGVLERKFYTADYEIVRNTVQCKHKGAVSDAYVITVKREMVVAVLNPSKQTPVKNLFMIPMCEEATIQIKRKNEIEQCPPSVFVIAAMPIIGGAPENAGRLHVFGDNAFTLLNTDATKYGDLTEIAMLNVGGVAKIVHSALRGEATMSQPLEYLLGNSELVSDLDAKIRANRLQHLNSAKTPEHKTRLEKINGEDITNGDRMSASFLSNHIPKRIFNGHCITEEWMVSATFSCIVISDLQRNSQSKTYAFVQTYGMKNGVQRTHSSTPSIVPNTRADSRKGISTRRNAIIHEEPMERDEEPAGGDEPGQQEEGAQPTGPTLKALFNPPPSHFKLPRNSKAVQSKFESSLPPELELELELL